MQPASSLELQTLIYFDRLYIIVYFALTLAIYIIKGLGLTYPPNTLFPEVVGLILFMFLQLCRLEVGSTANKRESSKVAFLFVLLCIPAGYLCVFYFVLQTYVYYADLVISGLLLFFLAAELLLGIKIMLNFRKRKTTN